MSDIITVQELCLWYGSHQALRNINMGIPEKSITALIGPSGCGKSTLLKTLNRMNDLVRDVKITGSVCYNGQDIYDPSTDVSELRRQIGMVFQKPNPFPMSIYDNIAYGPRTHGIRNKAKLDEIVERSMRDAAIWEEVKDRLKKNQAAFFGLKNFPEKPQASGSSLLFLLFKSVYVRKVKSSHLINFKELNRNLLSFRKDIRYLFNSLS